MSDQEYYPYCDAIQLHVEGRITPVHALRQQRTAAEILRRLAHQPGVILADEVGMGKTFVALAVAISVALKNRGKWPVVVMMPTALKKKWPTDFETFREKCLPQKLAQKVTCEEAETAVEFLKILSAPLEDRPSVVFLTHGAMSRGLHDPYIKLALIKQSLKGKRTAKHLYRILPRCLGKLLDRQLLTERFPNLWGALLVEKLDQWPQLLADVGLDEPIPVPIAIQDVLHKVDTRSIFEQLQQLPQRVSKNYDEYIHQAKIAIKQSMREVWKDCLARMNLKLPLLILDEAHHLKNQQTRLASLFQSEEACRDAEEITQGPLAGVFQRMLFLTATPFQLGHEEVCSVIDRFDGIQWKGRSAPSMLRAEFGECRKSLRRSLDEAQASAIRLDDAWGKLSKSDLLIGERYFDDSEAWWQQLQASSEVSPAASDVLVRYARAREQMGQAQTLLAPWVIRHLKPRYLEREGAHLPTRVRLAGRGIETGVPNDDESGISVQDEALLPFLLAARATFLNPEKRPIFAEGLASSYQAFMETRKRQANPTDDDLDEASGDRSVDRESKWYLDHLQRIVQREALEGGQHPKVAATVNRVVELWRYGEKVVVFCHFTKTSLLLRQKISEAIGLEIRKIAAERLRIPRKLADERLQRLGDRFFRAEAPLRKACDLECSAMIRQYPVLEEHADDLLEIIRRNLRTPSFLVRYFPIARRKLGSRAMARALSTRDPSGLSLGEMVQQFLQFLSDRCSLEDRIGYISAMHQIQTGSHGGGTQASSFAADELQGAKKERLLANVRLVNGGTQQATRQRLMLAFNTPFYPEVLIASSVMAEGVDLHLNCRHVIHHDLSWNPSMLEQRTGRVDRLGSKGERSGSSIQVYLPYISETQDEKMYRVVMDRERWFQVVMGEQYSTDASTTEKLAARIPFPASAAQSLAFDLSLPVPTEVPLHDANPETPPEVCLSKEMPPAEMSPAEMSPAEMSPAEMSRAEIPPAEIPPAEIPPAEIPPAEIPPEEMLP